MRFQRTRDLLVAAVLFVPVALVVAVAAAIVAVALGRPVFFRQTRSGINGKPFIMVKLRSMSDGRDAEGRLLPDSERLGRLGRLLRSTSVDELPSLWNVLRGEMSLVGPRPLLPEYLPLYSARQARRLNVLPGITGWAQINGRNLPTWNDRLEMDVWYVDHQSHLLDFRILIATPIRVLSRTGISHHGEATMAAFGGNDGG
jgi:sugar transferase EpsL